MKKIFLIAIVLLVGLVSISQPIVNRSNSSITVQDSRLAAQYNLLVPRYNDTTAANVQKGIDTCGAIIFTYSTNGLWVRSCADGKKWVAVGGGGGSGTVTSVSGTANQIAVATGTTTPVISLVTGGTLPGAWNLGTPSALVGTNISGTAAALSIGGNAATATALATGRTISISGDLTYTSPSFDGTGNVTAAGTLATVNANVGTFGSATQVPQLTVNAKGLITAVSNVTITVPTASLLPITGTGTATGAVIGSLAGNTLDIQQGANYFLKLDPTAGAENAELQAYNTTGAGNLARFQATASNTNAEYLIQGVFNATSEFSLNGSAVSGGSSLSYNADTHQFTGNVGIGVSPTVLFQVQSGGNDLLAVNPTAGSESAILQAYNTTSAGNAGAIEFSTSNTAGSFSLYSSFDGGAKLAQINGNAQSGSATLTYSADTHTFTGNILTATDNTYDIGSSTNSFKDIYARTAIFDGSTSGSFTVFSEATGIAGRGTTASGTGNIPAVMFAMQSSTNTLSDVNTVQAVFASGFDVFTLQASTTYRFKGMYYLTHGATAHSLGMSFELGGGASLTSIAYTTTCWVTTANTNTASQTTNFITQATNTAVNASGSNAQESVYFEGVMRVNAGGTVTPSITFSVAPGGTVLANINSFIEFYPIGSNTITSLGNVN